MKTLILSIALSIMTAYTAQGQLQCKTTETAATTANTETTAPADFWCSELSSYYPDGNDVVKVYANFIFLEPSSGVGKYTTLNSSHAQTMVDSLNSYFAHLKPPTYPLPNPPHNVDFLNNAKIMFTLKTTTHVVNDTAYYKEGKGFSPSDVYAINFIYCCSLTDPVGGGKGFAATNRLLMIRPINYPPLPDLNGDRLVLHEIGHVFGLNHTNEPPGELNDYWVEDTSIWNHHDSYYGEFPNNAMSSNFSRDYFSPKQIGKMHKMLRTQSPTKLAVQSYPSSYGGGCAAVPSQSAETIPANFTVTITNNPNWEGDVLVKSGAHLVISSTTVTMIKSSRIIVEPGAKLSIINSVITGTPCCRWKGLEVWGGNSQQNLNSSNIDLNNGVVELNNATISNAEIGVFLGKRAPNGNPVAIGGGGIILSKNSKYINNKIGVQFAPYFISLCIPPAPSGYSENLSVFKRDTFIVQYPVPAINAPVAAVQMDRVYNVKFYGCYFKDVENCTSNGIQGTNASVILKDLCTGTNTVTCNGSLIRNKFMGFVYGMRLTNNLFDVPSTIDHVIFDQDDAFYGHNSTRLCKGGLYISNSTGAQITNCDFKTGWHYQCTNYPTVYGLYLDNCSAFVVENNNFQGNEANNTNYATCGGIFVNNSGVFANSIYNNTFKNEHQGIWAQNENSGLIMQCNDFFITNPVYTNYAMYGIGVQSLYQGPNCWGCPTPNQTAGVSTAQGIITSTNGVLDYVRNTYSLNCANNSERQFYINTDNPFAVNFHGSFKDSIAHPRPQANACGSNPAEIVLQTSTVSIPNQPKSFYCPPNPIYLPTFSNLMLNQNGTGIRGQIHDLLISYVAMDRGKTNELLAMIHDEDTDETILKDSLLSPDFLSDEVLTAYFTRENVPHNYLYEVFVKNAPVNPLVWAHVSNIALSEDEQTAWDTLQFTGGLSAKNEIESQLTYARNKLGLINNEKIRRFLTDSVGVQYDSLISVYSRTNEMTWGKYRVVDVLVAAGRFKEANDLMDTLSDEILENVHFKYLQQYIISLRSDTAHIDQMKDDEDVRDYLINIANSNNALLEGYGKTLLAEVYDYQYQEVIYSPEWEDEGEGERLMNNSTEEQTAEKLEIKNEELRIYPNPASNQLIIECRKNTNDLQVQVLSLTGSSLISTVCKSNCTIDISALKNGVYFLNIYQAGKFLGAKKLVVLR